MLIDQIQNYPDDELELEVEDALNKIRAKERKMIELFAVGEMTMKQVAEECGFETSSPVSRIIKSPAGAWALAVLREQNSRRAKVTADWKRRRLRDIINIAMTQEKPDLKAAVSAIESLNKMDGDHAATKSKVEHTLLAARIDIDGLDVDLLSKLHHTLQSHHGRIIEHDKTPVKTTSEDT